MFPRFSEPVEADQRQKEEDEDRAGDPGDFPRGEGPAQAGTRTRGREALGGHESIDDRLEVLFVTEEDRIREERDIDREQADEVQEQDAQSHGTDGGAKSRAGHEHRKRGQPAREDVGRQVVGHHDSARHEHEEDLGAPLRALVRAPGQHDEREQGEPDEHDAHTLLDRRVKQDRRSSEIKEETEDRDSGAEEASADREDGRGEREQPEERLDPQVRDGPGNARRQDHVPHEDVSEGVERVGMREGVSGTGGPEPATDDFVREREVENRVGPVDDAMRGRDHKQEKDHDDRGDEERKLRGPHERHVERSAHHREEEQKEDPRDAQDSGLEFQEGGDQPQESHEADGQGHDVEVRRSPDARGQEFVLSRLP